VSSTRVAALGILLLTSAGCSASAPPTDSPPPPVNARCLPADSNLIGQLGAALSPGITVRNVYYVRSNELDHVLFLSAEVEGDGFEGPDDIGTWATDLASGGATYYEINDVAAQSGGWIPGSARGFTMTTDGAAESAQCAMGVPSATGAPAPSGTKTAAPTGTR